MNEERSSACLVNNNKQQRQSREWKSFDKNSRPLGKPNHERDPVLVTLTPSMSHLQPTDMHEIQKHPIRYHHTIRYGSSPLLSSQTMLPRFLLLLLTIIGTLLVVALGLWAWSSSSNVLSIDAGAAQSLGGTLSLMLLQRPGRKITTDTSRVTWQGLPLTHIPQSPPPSYILCIGENFNASTSWQYRSCAMSNLCLDTQDGTFVVMRSRAEADLFDFLSSSYDAWQSTVTLSTILSATHNSMSLQSLLVEQDSTTTTTTTTDAKWFPSILSETEASEKYAHGYYLLPNNVVWIPWQPPTSPMDGTSLPAQRYWLWTSWYPIFVLASLFDYTPINDNNNNNNNKSPQQLLPIVPPLFSPNAAQTAVLQQMQAHLGHALTINKNGDRMMMTTTPRLVCARHAVAGVGHLAPQLGETDSIGHGPTLQAFAKHVRRQVGWSSSSSLVHDNSDDVFLVATSNLDSSLQQRIQAAFPHVQTLDETTLPLPEQQAQALARARVLIMPLHEKCVAPLLVPDHTRVLVLYQRMSDFTDCVYLLNNAAHLHVEWMGHDVTEQALTKAAATEA